MTGFLKHPTVGISTSSAWRYIDASSQPHLVELKKDKIAGVFKQLEGFVF